MVQREREREVGKAEGASSGATYNQRGSGGSSLAAGQIEGAPRSNGQICREIYDSLTPHGQLDVRAIHVDVDGGEVTLSGMVSSSQAQRLAEEMAQTVSGVKVVHNHLVVRGEAQDERPGGSSPLPAD